MRYRVPLQPVSGASEYRIYQATSPGGPYELAGSVSANADPLVYEFELSEPPTGLQAQGYGNRVELSWDAFVREGCPVLTKAVPVVGGVETYTPQAETVWMQDALPVGAQWVQTEGLSPSSVSFSGLSSLRITATDGWVRPAFKGALSPLPDGWIVVYVRTDPQAVPDSFWIEFYVNGGFGPTCYWGTDWPALGGPKGSWAFRYGGEVPAGGPWVPLVLHTRAIGASGATGLAFGVAKREGTGMLYVDAVTYSPQQPLVAQRPHMPLHPQPYRLYRNGQLLVQTDQLTYTDWQAYDRSLSHQGGEPVYHFSEDGLGNVVIRWSLPAQSGTSYQYELRIAELDGHLSPAQSVTAVSSASFARVLVYADTQPITDQTPLLGEATGTSFVHANIQPDTLYYYRFVTKDVADQVTSTVETTYRTIGVGLLDYSFYLDFSALA